MKKFLFVVLFALHAMSFAVTPECRRNEIDCVGLCGRFIDTNNDGFCDLGRLSQPLNPEKLLEKDAQKSLQDTIISPQPAEEPEETPDVEKSKEVSPCTPENNNPNPVQKKPEARSDESAVSPQPGNKPDAEPASVKETVDENDALSPQEESLGKSYQEDPLKEDASLLPAEKEASKPPGADKPYDLILISILTLGSYLVTHLLKRFGVISKTVHRRIWNLVLLFTFLVSGILGLLLVVQLNYQVLGGWYLDFLYLHVEFGISMAIVSMIHALWHINYYAVALGIKSAAKTT